VYGYKAPTLKGENESGAAASGGVALESGHNSLVRSLQLWVMEAKDLQSGGKTSNPYCVVLFNDVKQAKTGTKAGESVFWGEEFRFSDIPPCRSRLRLLFFNASSARTLRDAEIGYVSINLTTLRTGKKVEEWYNIKPFQRMGKESVGAVRIAYILTNEQSLPMDLYEEFLAVRPASHLLGLLSQLKSSIKFRLSRSLH